MNKESYKTFATKYKGLPAFELLEAEFYISKIEDEPSLMDIRHRIRDEIEPVATFCDKIMQPDTNSYVDLYECKCFSDEDKDEIMLILKKIIILDKENFALDLSYDSAKEVEFISRCLKESRELKKQVLPYVQKLKDFWNESIKSQERIDYTG